jgi:hypothetical protein
MTQDDHRRLTDVQERIARLTAELRREEGRRDTLLARQLDNDGCDSRRIEATR